MSEEEKKREDGEKKKRKTRKPKKDKPKEETKEERKEEAKEERKEERVEESRAVVIEWFPTAAGGERKEERKEGAEEERRKRAEEIAMSISRSIAEEVRRKRFMGAEEKRYRELVRLRRWARGRGVDVRLSFPFEEVQVDKSVVEKVRGCIKGMEESARGEGVVCGVIGMADNLFVYACNYSYNFFVLLPLYFQVVSKVTITKSGFVAYRPRYGATPALERAASVESLAESTRGVVVEMVKDVFWFRDYIYVITPDPSLIRWLFGIVEQRYAPGDVVSKAPIKFMTAYLEFYGYGKIPAAISALAKELYRYGGT